MGQFQKQTHTHNTVTPAVVVGWIHRWNLRYLKTIETTLNQLTGSTRSKNESTLHTYIF
jgi:hypothetical protein